MNVTPTKRRRLTELSQLERDILAIIQENWDSPEEGDKASCAEAIFLDLEDRAKKELKELSTRDFALALRKLCAEGRINFDFTADEDVILADILKERRVFISLWPRE